MLERAVYVVEDEDPYVSEDICYAVSRRYIQKYSGAFPAGSLSFADAWYSGTRSNLGQVPLVDTRLAQNVGTVPG